MNKVKLLALTAVFIFVIAMVAIFTQNTKAINNKPLAQLTATDSSIEENTEDKAENNTPQPTKRNLRKVINKQTRRQKMKLRGQSVMLRINTRMNYLEKIITRVEAIAKKMKEKDQNTTEALVIIKEARDNLDPAKIFIENATEKRMLLDTTETENLVSAAQEFKNNIDQAYQSLRQSKKSLILGIKALKKLTTKS